MLDFVHSKLNVQEYKMKQIHNNPYSAHQDILLLLPWYVNKTLHGAENETVENHLKVCLTCRRELASLQKLAEAVRQEGSFDSTMQVSFSQLKKRIHKPDDLNLAETPKVSARSDHRKWVSKIKVMPRSAFAMAAVVLLSLLLPRFIDTSHFLTNDYRTLSNGDNPVSGGKNTISVIFSTDTEKGQIDKILALIQGQVIDGPDKQGIYKIAIAGTPAAKDILEKVSSLRNNPNVLFVEPAYALLSSVSDASKDMQK
jgi:hypothetical protein